MELMHSGNENSADGTYLSNNFILQGVSVNSV